MIRVSPVRFTDQMAAMRDFCELLGLRVVIESATGGWLVLAAHDGAVCLHSAQSSASGGVAGLTNLCFEAPALSSISTALGEAGFTVARIDEAYGRQLDVTDPLGTTVVVHEEQRDFYGYHRHQADLPGRRIAVVPVRFTDDAESYHRFLTALGLGGEPAPGGYATYAAPGGGRVGVHYRYDGLDELAAVWAGAADQPTPWVHLTFLSDDLTGCEADLTAAGYRVDRTDEEWGSFLDVIDPDGQSVQVHQWQ